MILKCCGKSPETVNSVAVLIDEKMLLATTATIPTRTISGKIIVEMGFVVLVDTFSILV